MNDYRKVLIGMSLFVLMHFLIWWSNNTQFIKETWKDYTVYLAILLAIPVSMSGYFGSRFIYDGLNGSVWSIRFIGFSLSWLVFPILTWAVLSESMFTSKTLICVFLSFVIIFIQLFWK